jgi:hypothetical protein
MWANLPEPLFAETPLFPFMAESHVAGQPGLDPQLSEYRADMAGSCMNFLLMSRAVKAPRGTHSLDKLYSFRRLMS